MESPICELQDVAFKLADMCQLREVRGRRKRPLVYDCGGQTGPAMRSVTIEGCHGQRVQGRWPRVCNSVACLRLCCRFMEDMGICRIMPLNG
ncbi:MAG: hypothetical protein ACLTBV_26755 [Enterocloster bolteae]